MKTTKEPLPLPASVLFALFVEGGDVHMLRKLSAAHYDFECKRAGRDGGIIGSLKPNQFNHLDNSQIQTLWKCCEIGSFLEGEERLMCIAFVARCTAALNGANDQDQATASK